MGPKVLRGFGKTPEVTVSEIDHLGIWFSDSGTGMRRGPKADRGNVSTVDGYTERWKQQSFEEARCQALAAQVRKLVSGQ